MKLSKILPLPLLILVLLAIVYVFFMHDSDKRDATLSKVNVGALVVPDLLDDGNNNINMIPAEGSFKIVHVFTTWCSCCKKEIPEIEKITKENEIIGLAWSNNRQEVIDWLSENGNPYKQVGFIGNSEAVDLGISKAPITIVIGSEGKIIYSHQGKLSKEEFDEKILPKTRSSD